MVLSFCATLLLKNFFNAGPDYLINCVFLIRPKIKAMKNLLYTIAFVSLASFLFMYTTCVSEDECKDDEMPHISRTFILSCQIKYKDGVAFDGITEFEIVKERCDGSQSGYFKINCSSSGDGIFKVNTEPLYSFNNSKDKVTCVFTAYHTPFYPAVETTETTGEVFDYAKANSQADEYDEITKMYNIVIPTNSDGTN